MEIVQERIRPRVEGGIDEKIAALIAFSELAEVEANTPSVKLDLSTKELVTLRTLATEEVEFLQDTASNIDANDEEAQLLMLTHFPEDAEETWLGEKDLETLKAMEFEIAFKNIQIGSLIAKQIENFLKS